MLSMILQQRRTYRANKSAFYQSYNVPSWQCQQLFQPVSSKLVCANEIVNQFYISKQCKDLLIIVLRFEIERDFIISTTTNLQKSITNFGTNSILVCYSPLGGSI